MRLVFDPLQITEQESLLPRGASDSKIAPQSALTQCNMPMLMALSPLTYAKYRLAAMW